MCLFVETIRLENGIALNLGRHQERMRRTMTHFFGAGCAVPEIDGAAKKFRNARGTCKLRIVYGREGITAATCEAYNMRPVGSLRLVEDNDIEYAYKSADRGSLDRLFALRNGCDGVLIVKNGLLTDTSYTNIALYDGQKWYTPTLPLLPGTMRAALLDKNLMECRDITPQNLKSYTQIALFNSMIDFGKIILPVSNII